jgi:hypothetical protein
MLSNFLSATQHGAALICRMTGASNYHSTKKIPPAQEAAHNVAVLAGIEKLLRYLQNTSESWIRAIVFVLNLIRREQLFLFILFLLKCHYCPNVF